MTNKSRGSHIGCTWLLSAGITIALGIAWTGFFSSRANAMDWTDVNAGNTSDWTGVTDNSSRVNFYNVNNASGNIITVQDAKLSGAPLRITGAIYGGYASFSAASYPINANALAIDNNSVTIMAPTLGATTAISGNVDVIGGFKYSSLSSSNTSQTTSISNNSVTIHSGVNLGTGEVAGATLESTSRTLTRMSNNQVTLYGGTMRRVFGAVADTQASLLSSLDSNSVTMDLTGGGILNVAGNSSSTGIVYGADFHGGSVTNNRVSLYANDSSTIMTAFDIFGGRSGFYPGTASNNTVFLDLSAKTTATTLRDIRGGSSGNNTSGNQTIFGNNTAYENEVDIRGDSAANATVREVVGGKTFNGIAERNRVYLTDVTATGDVMGGQAVSALNPDSDEGVADNNTVTILRGTIQGDIYGGKDSTVIGKSASGNSVTITDATITSSAVYGGFGNRTAGKNTVLVDLSTKTTVTAMGNVMGGSSGNNTASTQTIFGNNTASDNEVDIRGNSAANAMVREVAGGRAFNGYAERNRVYLTDITATGDVMGGQALSALNPDSDEGVADNNTVTILRGTVQGDIYGGKDSTVIGKSASGNSVTITDAAINSAAVYGGFSTLASANNSVNISGYGTSFGNASARLAGGNHGPNGNILTTTTAVNLRLGTIENFERYIFYMTDNEMDKTVYSVTNSVDLAGTSHTLNFDATQGPPLQEGQVLTLIDNTTNGSTLSEDKFVKNIKDGFLYNYDGFFGMDGDSLVFEILGREKDERNITFGQSQLAGLQMVNVASDLARSIHSLYNIQCSTDCYDNPSSTTCSKAHSRGAVIFAGAQAGTYNFTTGGDSRIGLNYISALTGAGWRRDNVLLAGYFETGHGKYNSKVNGLKVVDGDKSDYYGLGALARYEQDGFYGESGFHIGRVNTDFESTKFSHHTDPVHVKYKAKCTYLGIDALMGYKLNAGCSTFDFSGRYSWNHVGGDEFIAHTALFEQGKVNSHRVRTGIEWTYSRNTFHPYAGAFYEYEADAKSKHTVWGERLQQASQKGSNGIARIGFRFGGGERRVSADISVEGYLGKRRGVAGKALVSYAF